MTVTSAQVQTLLTDILGETTSSTANATDLSEYLALSNNLGFSTQASLAAQIANSPEAGIAQQVYRLYEAVLGRAPDAGGLQNWVATAEAGLTTAQIQAGVSSVSQATWNSIINGFTASAEFQAKYSGIGGSALVDLLYANILGRTPDSTGLATWTGILGSAVAGAGPTPAAVITVVNGIVNSAEFIKDTAANNAAATVAAALADTGTGPTYTVTAVTPVQTATNLSTGIDTLSLTGSNNTVNGTANGAGATYGVGDQIIGAAGSSGNVLNLSDLGTTAGAGSWSPGTLAGVTVSNIQTVNLTSAEAVTLDATSASAGFSGLTALNVISISGVGNAGNVDTIKVGASTAVKVTDTLSASVNGNLTVTGGSTVSITEANGTFTPTGTITVAGGSGTTSVSVVQTDSTGHDAAVSITDTNEGAGTSAGVITGVTIDGLDSNKTATIDDSALANLTVNNVSAGTVAIVEGTYTSPSTSLALSLNNDTGLTLTDAAAKIKTIAITTGASASTATIADTAATTLTVAGNSVVTLTGSTLSNVTAITISGAAGLTDTDYSGIPTLKTVTDTSSGAVSLSLNAATAFAGSTAKGAETIVITAPAAATIAGGTSGSNELVWNGAAAPGTSFVTGSGAVTGFSVLGIGGSDVGNQAYDLSKLTGFTSVDFLATVAGALTNNATYTVTNASGTAFTIDSGNNGHTLDIVYSTADKTGATDSGTIGIGTKTVTGFTVDSLTVADAAGVGIATLAVTSNGGTGNTNSLTTLVDTDLTSLTLSGKASLTIGALTDSATSLTFTNNGTSTVQSSVTATTAALTGLTIAGSDAAGTVVAISGDAAFGTFTLTDSGTGPVTATLGTLTNIQALVLNDSSAAAEGVTITAANNATALTLNNTGTSTLSLAGGNENALASLAFTGSGAETISSITSTYTATLGITDSDSAAVNVTAFTLNSLANLSITDSGSGNLLVAQGASTTHAVNIILANTGTGTLTVGTAGMDSNLTDTLVTGVTATGTGVTKLYLADTDGAAAVTVDFSGSSANDVIHVTHTENAGSGGTADVIKVGNGNNTVTLVDGTNVTTHTVAVTFGSGANTIDVSGAVHTSADAFTQSANTGVNSGTVFTAITGAASAVDTLTFAGNAALTISGAPTAEASVAAGITAGLATASGNVFTFSLAGNEYYFLHGDAGTALSAADSLVEVVGLTGTSTIAAHVITIH